MANQMTPGELRAAADPNAPIESWTLDYLSEAARRLADVIEHAESIAGSTRADSPYVLERASHQNALRILAIARGDTTNHENRSENDA